MDSTKQFGNIKENVDRENLARRNYKKKWGYLAEDDINKFYNQNEIADEINDSVLIAKNVYSHTGHGDSYFVSPEMYNTLLARCRCGRPKFGLHAIKCLQKRNKYLDETSPESLGDGCKKGNKIPETSAGFVGWFPCRYLNWEQSTKYVSPKTHMPGYRVTDHPYTHVFIG